MNWDYFLLLVFVIWVLNAFFGIICGALNLEKNTHYGFFDSFWYTILFIVLILMWFWT